MKHSIFNAWKSKMDEDYGISKYLSKDRDVMVSILAEMLKERGISLEEALTLKREVKNFLVTDPKSRKKDKRYNGWEENVEKDFDAAILEHYPPENKEESITIPTAAYGTKDYLNLNPIITAWAMDRFGVAWSERLNLECHKNMSKLLNDFEKEVLESKWAISGENQPKWYKNIMAKIAA
jgi:hypothetical protein